MKAANTVKYKYKMLIFINRIVFFFRLKHRHFLQSKCFGCHIFILLPTTTTNLTLFLKHKKLDLTLKEIKIAVIDSFYSARNRKTAFVATLNQPVMRFLPLAALQTNTCA